MHSQEFCVMVNIDFRIMDLITDFFPDVFFGNGILFLADIDHSIYE